MLRNRLAKVVFILFTFTSPFTSDGVSTSIKTDVDYSLSLLSNDIDSCRNYTIDLLKRSKDQNDHFGIVKSNYILGYLEKKQGDFGKAVLYYLEGIRYAKEAQYENASKDLVNLIQNTGNIFKKFGNHELARKYYSDAMEITSQNKDFQKYTFLVLQTAKTLKEEKKFEEASKLLESTFHNFNVIKKSTIADIYNQLGLIYTESEHKEKALANFTKLLDYVKDEPSLQERYSSWAYHNIGNLHFQNEDYVKAIDWFRHAIDYKLAHQASKESLFLSYKDISESYIHLRKFDSAEYFLDIAETYYVYSENVAKYYELYKFKSICRKERNDLIGYSTYQDLYSSSLENYLEEQRQIEASDKKYNLDLITQRYFALVAEQERNQQIQYYSAVGGSFLVTLIVLIIAFFQYRKYRLRKDLEASLKPYIKDTL